MFSFFGVLLGVGAEIDGVDFGYSSRAINSVLIFTVDATVGAYPARTPNIVNGISNLEMRFLTLINRYRIKVSPNTQPT